MVLGLSNTVEKEAPWLSLVVGNTRLHWGFFQGAKLISSWHTLHMNRQDIELITKGQFQREAWLLTSASISQKLLPASLPTQPIASTQLWIASAVPEQTSKWIEAAKEASVVHNSCIPIEGLYETLGCDRAINLLGAGNTLGWPVLVIDAGTALTFTAGTTTPAGNASFYGGAILPGVRLQRQALGEQTAALIHSLTFSQSIFESADNLKNTEGPASSVPDRWATDTSNAIASGLVYGMLSSITDYLWDWWRRFPTGRAIMTGGDSPRLYALLLESLSQNHGLPHSDTHTQQRTPEIISRVQADCTVDTHLMFWGMKAYRQILLKH